MTQEDYIVEAMRQLSKEEHYSRLDRDPTPDNTHQIILLLGQMRDRKSINEETWEFLTPLQARTAKFYLLRKVHKPGNPGRPIVSSCEAPTEKISQFLNYHLRPYEETLPSYLKDTTDFLLKLQSLRSIPDNTLLVTLDVSSLYTNIPHSEGIEACREALNSRVIQQPPTETD